MQITELLNDETVSYTISNAQNKEDLILAGFFDLGKKGFYVDVGANDPVADSVTKRFYDHGWSGINIEPIQAHFNDLQRSRPRDINLNVGVANKPGTLVLREYTGSGLSTFSDKMKKEYESNKSSLTDDYNDYEVPVKKLSDIFFENKVKKIDFMKVDVEGYEYDVLASNDWKQYRPRVLCIESNHIENDWRPILLNNSYKKEFFDGLNEYYVDSKASGLKQFSYVESVVSNQPIITNQLLLLLEEKVGARLFELEESLEKCDKWVGALEYHKNLLIKELDTINNMSFIKRITLLPGQAIESIKNNRAKGLK